MTAPALLAVDIGTSSIKVTAFDLEGRLLALRRAETPTERLPDGRAEHDADALWNDAAALIRGVVGDLERHAVEAVAATSVGEAGIPLDADLRPVRPGFAWFDARGGAEADWWRQAIGAEAIYRITGQPLDAFYSVNRLLWMRSHEPEAFARTRHWLAPADLVLLRLADRCATDFSLATRTLLFDQARLDWSDELLGLAALDRSLLPEPLPSGTRIGAVTRSAAAQTGLRQGTPVVLGGHDRLCAAFAVRGVEPVAVDSTGSAEALIVPVDDVSIIARLEPGIVSCYADVIPGRYTLSARVGYAAALTDWHRREVSRGSLPADIDEAVGWPLKFSGLLCYPSFGRLLAPTWDERARQGAILGLTLNHTAAHILQGLVEAVGYSLRSNLDWLEARLGRPVPALCAEGSLTQSRVWMQIKADITGRRLDAPDIREATSLGAALLAGIGAGFYRDHATAAAAVTRETTSWMPSPWAKTYDRVYRDGFKTLPGLLAAVSPLLQDVGEGAA